MFFTTYQIIFFVRLIVLLLNRCQEAIEYVESTRHKKLDAVRRIFHNAYVNKIAAKSGGAGGIGNFLDQFAEKVGIRSGKTTLV